MLVMNAAQQQSTETTSRVNRAVVRVWQALSGSRRRETWKELSRKRKIVLVLAEMAVVGGGMFNFHLNPPFIAAILLYSWLFNRGRPTLLILPISAIYLPLLVNTIDEILNIAPLLMRENFWPSVLVLFVLPAGIALTLRRWLPYLKGYRIFLCAATVITALGGNLFIRSATPDDIDFRTLQPLVEPLVVFGAPMGDIETPRTLLVDRQRNLLWVSYRYRSFTPPASGYLPVSLDRIDLTDGSRQEIRIDGGEVIGMAIDESSGRVYASLARRPLDNPLGLGDAVRELVALEPDGSLVHRREIPGAGFDYYNWVHIDGDRVLLHGEKTLLQTDRRLSSFTSQAVDLSPTWTFCGAVYRAGEIYRVFSGAPLKGFFLRAFSLDVISQTTGKSRYRIKHNLSGLYDIRQDPQTGLLLAINNFVDQARVSYYDSDLNLIRTIDLPGVVRAFATDFERRRLATVEYITGHILLFDIDSGLPQGETTIGIGSRGLVFGPAGELYVGAEIGILRVDTDSLIRNRLLPDFDNEGSSQ
jgi:hypothetical protein